MRKNGKRKRGPRSGAGPKSGAVLLAAALLLTACAGADAGAPATMETTTEVLPNGATLVRHTPPPAGVPVTWRLAEELRIGTMDGGGPAQFGNLVGLAVSPDGRIVVLDAQAQEIRVFGPDGEHLQTLGGEGGGPGEMVGANAVLFGPDGLLRVPDARNNRISFFDLETGFVRSHPYTPLFMTWPWDGVVDAEGNTWSLHWMPGTGQDDSGQIGYVGYDPSGTAIDTFPAPRQPSDPTDDHPGLWNVWRGDTPMASLAVPFYPRQRHFLDPRLHVWSTVEGDPAYRLERWTLGGDTTLVVETDRPLQPVDQVAADSITTGWEERMDTRLDRSKIPDTAPALIDHFTDDDGRLWAQARTARSDSVRTFDVYDGGDGRWIGTLATDYRLSTTPRPVIRGEQIWAVVRDELDVPYVIRATLQSTAEDGP